MLMSLQGIAVCLEVQKVQRNYDHIVEILQAENLEDIQLCSCQCVILTYNGHYNFWSVFLYVHGLCKDLICTADCNSVNILYVVKVYVLIKFRLVFEIICGFCFRPRLLLLGH